MVGRINTPSYSVAKQSIATSDQREGNGYGGGRSHDQPKEESKEEIFTTKAVTVDELTKMIDQINSSDYYKKKGFKFVLRSDSEKLLVEVFSSDDKKIQTLTATQTQKIFEVTGLDHSSTKIGGLINITC